MMIQWRRKKSNNSVYIWIFAILWVLLWVWYIFANNDKSDDTDTIVVDTWSVMSWDDLLDSVESMQYIPWANLIVDRDARPSIDISVWSDSVVFTDSMWSGRATLTYFSCEANDATRDCNTLLNANDVVDTFTTAHGITFAKQADGSWIGTNDNTIWYKVVTDDDQLLRDLSNVLVAINKSYIESNISDKFTRYCYDAGSTMTTITSQQTRNVSDVWMTIVDGVDIDGNQVNCSITTTIEDWELVLKITNYDKWSSDTVTTGSNSNTGTQSDTISVSDTSEDTQTTTTSNAVGTVPNISSSGVVFNSTRWWYSVTFPSTNVLYQGTNVNTNLWLSDTNCYVSIWVKAYTDRDNTSVWYGANIYECASKLSPDTIKSQLPAGTNVQTSPDWSKVFIIQSNDSSRNNFAQSIDIGALETTPVVSTWDTITVE